MTRLKVCFIGKYPPIQGGVSARGALLVSELSKLDHDVHVVTNASDVVKAYEIWTPGTSEQMDLSADGKGSTVPSSIRVVRQPSSLTRHIPNSSAAVSRLAGAALEVVRANQCDLIFSNYLEPYAVAAHLVANWTGLPHVVKTAGSDRFRLMKHPDMAPAYKAVLRSAACIIGPDHTLSALGIDGAAQAPAIPAIVPAELFHDDVEPLCLPSLVRDARVAGYDVISPDEPDEKKPTLGYYGKIGPAKGIYELLEAVGRIRGAGKSLNLVILGGAGEERALRAEVARLGITECVWLLPFIPYDKVSGYLRACDAIALLENNFSIKQHMPMKLRECLSTGTYSLVSREIMEKEPRRNEIIAGKYVSIVEDPTDVDSVERALDNLISPGPHLTKRAALPGVASSTTEWASQYESIFVRIARRGGGFGPASTGVLDRIVETAPWIEEVLQEKVGEAFDCFSEEFPVDSPLPVTALSFVRYTRIFWRKYWPDTPIWLSRYLTGAVWLAFDIEHFAGVPLYANNGSLAGKGQISYPLRTNFVRLLPRPDASSSQKVADVVSEMPMVASTVAPLFEGERADELVFLKKPDYSARIFRASAEVAQLIRSADGHSSKAELEERIGLHRSVFDTALEKLKSEWVIRNLSSRHDRRVVECGL